MTERPRKLEFMKVPGHQRQWGPDIGRSPYPTELCDQSGMRAPRFQKPHLGGALALVSAEAMGLYTASGRGRSSGVEHNLAKVRVVSSNLIARSIKPQENLYLGTRRVLSES